MSETVFDKILKKEIPSNVVYEDDKVYAFKDISPQAPTHILVIPKKKLVDFTELADAPPEEVGALFKGAAKVAKQLGLAEEGYRIVVNSGKFGQQTVSYLHLHVIGGRQLRWPPG